MIANLRREIESKVPYPFIFVGRAYRRLVFFFHFWEFWHSKKFAGKTNGGSSKRVAQNAKRSGASAGFLLASNSAIKESIDTYKKSGIRSWWFRKFRRNKKVFWSHKAKKASCVRYK